MRQEPKSSGKAEREELHRMPYSLGLASCLKTDNTHVFIA